MRLRNFLKFTIVSLLLSSCDNDILTTDKDAAQGTTGTTIQDTNSIAKDFYPTSTTSAVIHREGYSFSYAEDHEQSEWVAYYLDEEDFPEVKIERPYFYADPKVNTGSATYKDYTKSGYSRGHLCPAGDRKASVELYDETFWMSNICPQEQSFNAGVWLRLENQVRDWALSKGGVYVATGPVLKKGLPTIGNTNKVSVPELFYKVLLSKDQKEMIAFLMPHEATDKEISEFVVTTDQVEALTGVDFYAFLDDTLEAKLEKSKSTTQWPM